MADHPREQVLRRDVHRPEQQHLPVADAAISGRAAQELLRNRPLQLRQLHLAGQRAGHAGRHPGRLPVLRPFLGSRGPIGLTAAQPQLRPDDLGAGRQRRRGSEWLRLPVEREDALRSARCGARQLEGLCPGPRLCRSDSARALRRHPLLRCPVSVSRADRQHRPAQSEHRERDRPVSAQALPVPVVRIAPELGPLRPGPYRQPV